MQSVLSKKQLATCGGGVGRGRGVGEPRGGTVAVAVAVAVAVGDGVCVAVAVAVAVGDGVCVAVAVAVAVGDGVCVAVAVAVLWQCVNVADGVAVGEIAACRPPPVTLTSTEVVVLLPVYPPTATAVLPTWVPAGNERCWFRVGPVVQLLVAGSYTCRAVRRIRAEQPVEPCFYSRLA